MNVNKENTNTAEIKEDSVESADFTSQDKSKKRKFMVDKKDSKAHLELSHINLESKTIYINDKKYRKNVGAIVLGAAYPLSCRFFLGERHDLKNIWQFPQGGIDKGESPKDALYRELGEEIGTSEIEIIAKYPKWVSYDFPPSVASKMQPYDGQIQKYFLVKLKKDSNVNIETKDPEFARYEFVEYDELLTRINHFKKGVYMRVLNYFRKQGYI